MRFLFVFISVWFLSHGLSCLAQSHAKTQVYDIIRQVDENDGINIKAGMDSLEKALVIAEQSGDVILQADVLKKMTEYVTSRLNNFSKASECVEKMGKLARENPALPWLKSDYHNGLGVLYFFENIDRARAGKEFEKAIIIARENKLEPSFSLLNNYALSLQAGGRYYEAMEYYKRSQVVFANDTSVGKQKRFLLKSFLNIGICMINMARHDSAEIFFRKGIDLARETSDAAMLFNSLAYFTVFLQEHFRYDEAIEYFNEAQQYLNSSQTYELKSVLFQSMADIYKDKGDFRKAHDFRQIELLFRDSLRNKKTVEKALSIDYRLEVDSINHQKQLSEIQMQAEREKYKVHAFAIVSLLILVVSVATFWLYRLHKQKQLNAIRAQNEAMEKEIIKQQAELELLKKEEQLIASSLQLSVKETDLNTIKEKLQKHVEKSGDPQFDELKNVLSQVKSSERKSEHLRSINELISSKQSEFYKKVKKQYPSLTDDEMRLIMLLRLNLSSDELIMLFNISRSSLNTKRYRLRKKMGLARDAGLEDFIMQI
jgi:tetratricopeptide (TPR) repeat protein